MKHTTLFFIFILFNCTNSIHPVKESSKNSSFKSIPLADTIATDTVIKEGYLRIMTDVLDEKTDSLLIYSMNGNIYTKISGDKYTEPFIHLSNEVKIEAYYPDYYVLIFKSTPLINEYYVVNLNGKSVRIKHKDGITIFENRETYIKKCILVTSQDNPLKTKPSMSALNKKIEGSYEDIFFEVVEIQGEWANVKCLLDCEGCPNNKLITGWIRWLRNDAIVVKLYYTC